MVQPFNKLTEIDKQAILDFLRSLWGRNGMGFRGVYRRESWVRGMLKMRAGQLEIELAGVYSKRVVRS